MKEDILGHFFRVKGKNYTVILKTPSGRYERALPFQPIPGAGTTNKGEIHGEPPERMQEIYSAAFTASGRLADEGAYSARGRILFSTAMRDYVAWHKAHRNDPKIELKARPVLERFSPRRLSSITRAEVRQWVDEYACDHAHYTTRNALAIAKGCVNWLTKETLWDGPNVFSGHEWKAATDVRVCRPTITLAELHEVMNALKSRQTQQAMMIAYFSGLRPSEVCRVRAEDFDHDAHILKAHETKTRNGERYIAVPIALSTWVVNNSPLIPMNNTTITHTLCRLASGNAALSGLCLETFRKNYAALMESAGASHETIDAHQGRYQSSVIAKHYLRDKLRAVNLMRPFIAAVFDGELEQLRASKWR